jgi:hypothetical protein
MLRARRVDRRFDAEYAPIMRAQRTRKITRVFLGLALLFGLTRSLSACPNCKEAVAAQPEEVAAMKDGYNYSVLFMLAVPFSLLGLGSFMVARAAKRGALPEL